MDTIINLELDDKNSYKQPFKEQFKDLKLTDVICEILGSVNKIPNKKLNIGIHIDEFYIYVYHNGEPIDNDDLRRLMKMATHGIMENKKGVSMQGVGWRSIATVFATQSFTNISDQPQGISTDNIYSYMISKVNKDIDINNIVQKKNSIITLIHDDDYKICIQNKKGFNDIYDNYLKNDYGVLFIIPNKNTDQYNDNEICHNLKMLYNRMDCNIIYKNEVTGKSKDIFENKPSNYIDSSLNNRYLECKCEMFTYHTKKVCKMTIINLKNINGLEDKPHYFWIETYRAVEDNFKKYEYEDWSIKIENEGELISDNFYFHFRMMGFNPDTLDSNDEFKKWSTFYSPGSITMHYGDGILPYINNTCLKYSSNEKYKGYLKYKLFHAGNTIHKGPNYKSGYTCWKRNKGNETIIYKPYQNVLIELIEFRDNIDKKKSLLSLKPIKSQTNICDGKGYIKTIPYFLVWLNHKYIWYQSSEEIIDTTVEEQLIIEKKEKEKALKLAEKERKEKEKAQKKAEREEKKKEIAEQKAEREENKKILAEQKAEREEEMKILAEQKAKEEEEMKILAEQKAKEEEEMKILAEQKAKEEEDKKKLAEVKSKQDELKKKKSMVQQEKLQKIAQECLEEKIELEKELEVDYIPIQEESNINEGYCYCFMDPTRPNLRKIGKTSKDKDTLCKQYIPRYMPRGIEFIQWEPFNNSKLAEECIFEKLKTHRIDKTEWFEFEPNSNTDELIAKKFNDLKIYMKD